MILEYKKKHNISINNHLYKLKNRMKDKLKKGRVLYKKNNTKIYTGNYYAIGTNIKELSYNLIQEYKKILKEKEWEKYNTLTGDEFLKGYKFINKKKIKL